AEAGGDPGEVGEPGDEAAGGHEGGIEARLEPPPLALLAGGEGDTVQVLVDPHQGEAQVRLARVTLGVAADEAATHPIGKKRAESRVEKGGPHHVPGYRNVVPAEGDREPAGEDPEDADEGDEQHRGLQEPGTQVSGELAEMARVLVHSLVRIDPHG